ncbi:MAG: transcriptional regulator, IclR family protein, partial [Betaproteobacteria bacterium]|nr:transcriptional regulator, IclR family protein [Betaproteobacteria bacterium]
MKLPLHSSALGRVIVANLEPARQLELLATLHHAQGAPHEEPANLADLRRELDLTRARGYAVEL